MFSKYLKYIIPSLVFYLFLEFFFKSFGLSIKSLLVIFALSILSSFWITRYRFLPIILTVLFSSGSVLFLLTLGKNSFQYAYIVFSSFVFMLSLVAVNRFFIQQENLKDREKREERKLKILDSGFNLNQSIILISIFLFSSGIYALYINLDFSLWVLFLAIFIAVFFATFYLTRTNFLKSLDLELHLDSAKNKTFLFYSMLSGFLAMELIWTMSFLPINHITVGAVTVSLYFSFWSILKSYLRNELRKKVIVSNLLFFLIATSIIIFTSRWDIV